MAVLSLLGETPTNYFSQNRYGRLVDDNRSEIGFTMH